MIWVITTTTTFGETIDMIPFDPLLKTQHDGILAVLKTVVAHGKNGNQNDLKSSIQDLYQRTLEHDHHEWELLFSKHAFDKDLNQGGPFCMYFFESFMMNRPQEKVLQLLKSSKNDLLSQKEFQIEESFQPVFAANSMMSVPLEEHTAIKLLLEALMQNFATAEKWDSLWFNRGCELLSTLIQKNIEKEETCLWILIQNLCAKPKS